MYFHVISLSHKRLFGGFQEKESPTKRKHHLLTFRLYVNTLPLLHLSVYKWEQWHASPGLGAQVDAFFTVAFVWGQAGVAEVRGRATYIMILTQFTAN